MDTGSRREDSKAVRDEILGPQGDEMRCKMECLVTVKCRYSLCKTDDFVFSVEFGRRSACEGPFDLIRGPLGAQNVFGWAIYSIFLMHKRATRVDLGSHGSAASQPLLRVCSVFVRKNECFVVFSD